MLQANSDIIKRYLHIHIWYGLLGAMNLSVTHGALSLRTFGT